MQLEHYLRELRDRREKLCRAITALEELTKTEAQDRGEVVTPKRGRKSMGPDERRQVSERMKQYWASRRKR